MAAQETKMMIGTSNRIELLLYGNRFRPGLIKQTVVYITLFILAAVFLLPFYWMAVTAVKPNDQIFSIPPIWLPTPFQWSNFVTVVTTQISSNYPTVLQSGLNTLIITVNGVIATLFSSSLVAYAFARMEFRAKNVLFLGILSTLMVPFAVIMVPQFILWTYLGWLDSYLPLMVPQWFASPWNVFLMRQFFMTIPKEYDEAALLDGASHWDIYFRIMLPLSKPVLAAVAVFAFVFFWNDFLNPLIILVTPTKFTLTMFLANFSMMYQSTQWNLYMAAALVIITPCLILFFLTQNLFLRGINITGRMK
ncbi:MAG: carbohydrate ABC transporter permease [Chloroflexi bacterium]|nr:carbohydrate ABC transporter permease [Chloroflexota bacterium]